MVVVQWQLFMAFDKVELNVAAVFNAQLGDPPKTHRK